MNFSRKLIHLLQENSCPKQPFESVLKKASTTIPKRYLTIDELKVTFFFLKMKKSTGADEISFNLIKNCFGELSDIFRYAFDYLCKRRHFQILWRLQKWPLYLKLVTLRKLVITAQFLVCHVSLKYWSVSCTTTFLATYLTKKYIIFEAVWLPKRLLHRACYCWFSWPNS